MSLSTFNSRNAWKVTGVVVLVLVLTELSMRLAQSSLSFDLVHIAQVPESVAQLSHSTGLRMLFLGNSISREGIDLERFRKAMSGDREVTVAQVYPDDTSVLDWLHAYRHFVLKQSNQVDVVILCFAENQLQDNAPIHIRRLAHYYSDWDAAPGIFSSESFSFDQCLEFVLAKVSVSYANADRVRTRILDWVVPYYRTSAEQMNMSTGSGVPSNGNEQPTYRRLKTLIEMVHASGSELVVTAFPVGYDYPLEPGLVELLERDNVMFVDARQIEGITKQHFPDGYHMNHEAAQLMSSHLAVILKNHEFKGKRAERRIGSGRK